MPKYNHLYGLGFSVDSDGPGGATAGEILSGIAGRLAELRRTGEVLEAVGVPEETVESEVAGIPGLGRSRG
jgi:hypothetical protein